MKIVKYGTDLSSRRTGEVVRNKILAHTEKGKKIEVDLKGVTTMCQSFADEAFGVIVHLHGYIHLQKHVKFINAQNHIKNAIAEAILIRVREQDTHE